MGFLCLLLPARTGIALSYGNGAAGAAVAVALFALPLLYAVLRGRVVWDRHGSSAAEGVPALPSEEVAERLL